MKNNLSLLVIMFVIGLMSVGGVSAEIPADCPDGMISYWTLDDADLSGNNPLDVYDDNDGITSGATISQTGQVGQAFSFDSTNDYININSAVNDVSTNEGTWSAWVKPNSISSYKAIFSVGDWSLNTCTWPTILNGKFSCDFVNDNSRKWTLATDNVVFTIGEWTHVAIVHDGTAPLMYINGVAVDQTFSVGTASGKTWWIGDMAGLDVAAIGARRRLGSINYYFNGKIDEVAFFNRALTEKEIKKQYKNGFLCNWGYCQPACVRGIVLSFY